MSKFKSVLVAGSISVAMLGLVGCGQEEQPKENNEQLTQTQKDLEKTKGELEAVKEQQNQQGTQEQQQTEQQPVEEDMPNGDAMYGLDSDDIDMSVSRDEVFDIIETMEGSMNTDVYEYNEPEEKSDGSFGLAFYNKETGELAGSYTVDKDGIPWKYDEDGELIW